MASVSIEEYWIKARYQALKCASRSTTSFTYSSIETLLSLYFTHPHLSIVLESFTNIRRAHSVNPETLFVSRKGQKTKTLYHPNRYFNRSPPKIAIEIPFRVPIK
jgi:hypothetical protein